MVGTYVEIPYKNKFVKAATMFVNKTVQAFKMIWDYVLMSNYKGLYEQFRNYSLFLKLTATERISMLHLDLLINNLYCISSRMCRRSTPPFPFLSYLYGTLKPFISNCAVGKESSSFASDIRSKSMFLSIMYVSASNLFLTELILRWHNIDLSGD